MSAAIIAQAGLGVLDFLQGLAAPKGADASGASTASNGSSGSTAGTTGHHHHHGGAFEKLASALTSALQSAGSGGSVDVNQTITDALTKIFKTGGLGTTGQADTDGDSDQSTSTTNPTSTTGTTTTTDPNDGLPDALVQVLKAVGVTPQQFQTDITNAVKAAQASGQFDPSVLLKSFPIGTIVNAVG